MSGTRIYVSFIALFFLCCSTLSNCERSGHNASVYVNNTSPGVPKRQIEYEMEAMQKWKNAEKLIHKATVSSLRRFLVFVAGQERTLNINQKCLSDIGYLMRGLASMKFWAYRMLDSSSRLPSGILSGSVSNFGDFDGCLSVDVSNRFKGKYCNIRLMPVNMPLNVTLYFDLTKFLKLDLPEHNEKVLGRFLNTIHPYYAYFLFRMSVCVPSSCSEKDLEMLAREASEYSELHWEPSVVDCTDADEPKKPFNGYEITAMTMLFLIAAIALIGTTLEIYLMHFSKEKNFREKAGTILKILLCFSFVTNTKRLLKKDDNPESIHVFHGMKTFTILWVILNHTYNSIQPENMEKAFYAKEIVTTPGFQLVLNGYPTVDTFFFISGIIVVYARMSRKDSAFSVPLYIFRRVWRLAPAVIFLIFIFFVLTRFGSGPIWKSVIDPQVNACYKHWWTNLLFINNFYRHKEMCMGWLWYVGADMQLYLAALVVLIPIKRRPKLGLWILGICSVLSVVAIIVNQLYWDLPPTVVMTGFRSTDDLAYMTEKGYYRSYPHAIVYCLGMATGYIIYKKPNIRLPLWLNFTGWLTVFIMGLSIVYGVYKWNAIAPATTFESLIYATGSKIGWSVCLAWVVIMCYTGNGGYISKFLSWNLFVPFSRMTYSTFLVHMFPLLYFFFSAKGTLDAHHRVIAFLYMGFVVAAFMCAFVFTQLFEAPFMLLEKLMLPGKVQVAEEVKQNGLTPEDMMEKNNINHAYEHEDKGTYVISTNKAELEYKSEMNSSSL